MKIAEVTLQDLELALRAFGQDESVDLAHLLNSPVPVSIGAPSLAEIVRALAAHDTPKVTLGFDDGRVRFAADLSTGSLGTSFAITFD